MNVSFKVPTAIGLLLAIPLFVLPAHGAAAYDTGHKATQRRVADFAEATAYASPIAPIAQGRETDGLSRKDDDCNLGCIDH